MALVADSFEPSPLRLSASRSALPASLILHGLLLAGALWFFNRPQVHDTPDLESVSVSIITTQSAADTSPTPQQSDAAQSMLAAGATTPVTATPVEMAEVTSTEPVEIETQPSPIEIAEPIQTAATAPAPPESVAIVAEQLVALTAEIAIQAVEAVVHAEASTQAVEIAEATPANEAAKPIEDARQVVATVKPVEPAVEQPVAKPEPKPEKAAKPKPVEKTKSKPPAKLEPATSGSGGKSDANSVASSAASGGSGKVAAGGSKAESKYPGLVQAALRRALRFPSNAGNARGQALVRFLVAANGGVSGITIVSSTGSSALDQAAIDTVRRAAPFPPIPAEAGRASWSFTLPLQFRR